MFGLAVITMAVSLLVPQVLAITGGKVDTDNNYSNVGALVMFPPGYEPFPGASGILIHPRVLLTAGHVTDFIEQHPDVLPFCRVSFGTDALDPSTWLEIETVITHPNYRPGGNCGHKNDVGIIILKTPVFDVPTEKLPDACFLDDLWAEGLLREPGHGGVPFKVVGYGSTLDWPPPVTGPRDGWRRFADSEYLALLPEWLHLLQNPATGNGGTGFGDSGGPVFWYAPDGTRVLVAVTSWGDPKLVAMNFYWRTDIPETLDFTNDVIAMVDAGLL
jgi:hypothetical protein